MAKTHVSKKPMTKKIPHDNKIETVLHEWKEEPKKKKKK